MLDSRRPAENVELGTLELAVVEQESVEVRVLVRGPGAGAEPKGALLTATFEGIDGMAIAPPYQGWSTGNDGRAFKYVPVEDYDVSLEEGEWRWSSPVPEGAARVILTLQRWRIKGHLEVESFAASPTGRHVPGRIEQRGEPAADARSSPESARSTSQGCFEPADLERQGEGVAFAPATTASSAKLEPGETQSAMSDGWEIIDVRGGQVYFGHPVPGEIKKPTISGERPYRRLTNFSEALRFVNLIVDPFFRKPVLAWKHSFKGFNSVAMSAHDAPERIAPATRRALQIEVGMNAARGPNALFLVYSDPEWSRNIPVTPGETYRFSARLGGQIGHAHLFLEFVDGRGDVLGAVGRDRIQDFVAPSRRSTKCEAFGVAPEDATHVRCVVRMEIQQAAAGISSAQFTLADPVLTQGDTIAREWVPPPSNFAGLRRLLSAASPAIYTAGPDAAEAPADFDFELRVDEGDEPVLEHCFSPDLSPATAEISGVELGEVTARIEHFDGMLCLEIDRELVAARRVVSATEPVDVTFALPLEYCDGLDHELAVTASGALFPLARRTLPIFGRVAPQPTPAEPGRRVLAIGWSMPDEDGSAGDRALIGHLRALIALGMEVTFAPADMVFAGERAEALLRFGIACQYAPYTDSIYSLLRERGTDLDLVWTTPEVAEPLVDSIREHAPQAVLVLDLLDDPPSEQAGLLRDAHAMKTAASLIGKADLVVVQGWRESADPVRLPFKPLLWLPPVSAACPPSAGHEARQGLCMLGNGLLEQDSEAAEFLANEVRPSLVSNMKEQPIRIFGGIHGLKTGSCAGALEVETVSACDIGAFDRHRICAFPQAAGDQTLGLLEAMASGIACIVTARIAAALDSEAGEMCLIANDKDAWVQAIDRLNDDPALWQRLTDRARDFVSENCSVAAVATRLREGLPLSLSVASDTLRSTPD